MFGILSFDQVEIFQCDGLLILCDFYVLLQVELIQCVIYDIIGLVIDKYCFDIECVLFVLEWFDDGYQVVIKVNCKYGVEVYDVVKQIFVFVCLLGDECYEQFVC